MEILPQLIANGLISGSIYALASCGMALSYGLLRILNFAHGHFMMLGAYFFYLCTEQLGFSFVLSSFLILPFAALITLISLRIFILPFTAYSYLLVFVTTLALSIMLENLISITFGVEVKSLDAGTWDQSIYFWGVYLTPIQIFTILSALLLLSIVAVCVHLTPFGRKMRALSENPYVAQSLAINKTKIIFGVFFFASLMALCAGLLLGFESSIQPGMGEVYTIKAFAAMLLGGLGNLWGAVVASYMLGVIENLGIGVEVASFSIPSGYKDALAFALILLVLLFRPQGIFKRSAREV